ncbi:MAG: hypothetical protein ACHQHN_19180 [Sphingobacteriales bacterium]
MKKIYLSLMAIAFAINFSQAQWTTSGSNIYNSNTGNVGIGTTSPRSKLDVINTGGNSQLSLGDNGNISNSSTIRMFGNSGQYNWLIGSSNNVSSALEFTPSTTAAGTTFSTPAMTILNTGSVGIGLTSPNASLDVFGSDNDAIRITDNGRGGQQVLTFNASSGSSPYTWNIWGDPSGPANGSLYIGQTITNPTTGATMTFQTNGNVGIGTTNPQGYKLAVNGSAIATSMTVKLYANWPDYVFKRDYHLPKLTDIKTYIDANHRLPEMPSEQQIAKDGLNLGEMNKLLVKKIEELTLYMFKEDKRNDALQSQVTKQQAEIADLKKQMVEIIKKSK